MRIDSTPFIAKVPFENEWQMQLFAEKHFEKILGLTLIASSTTPGQNLFGIDILAVDMQNTPYIVECKWDLIDASVIEQLYRYRKALLNGWSHFEERVSEIRRQEVVVKRKDPVLVALGYCYDLSVLRNSRSIVCLNYAYHNVTLKDDEINEPRRGKVRIQLATSMANKPHSPITKRHLFLQRCPIELRKVFSEIDCSLTELDGVKAFYVKDSARYRLNNGYFAEAKSPRNSDSVLWTCGTCLKWTDDRGRWKHCEMSSPLQVGWILKRLRRAYNDGSERRLLSLPT